MSNSKEEGRGGKVKQPIVVRIAYVPYNRVWKIMATFFFDSWTEPNETATEIENFAPTKN